MQEGSGTDFLTLHSSVESQAELTMAFDPVHSLKTNNLSESICRAFVFVAKIMEMKGHDVICRRDIFAHK